MPQCPCSRCQGSSVSTQRTVEDHIRRDKAQVLLSEKAQKEVQRIISTEDEEIRMQLASMTLHDHTQTHPMPGGRLWGNNGKANTPPSTTRARNISTTQHTSSDTYPSPEATKLPSDTNAQQQLLSSLESDFRTIHDATVDSEKLSPEFREQPFACSNELATLKAMYITVSKQWPSENKITRVKRTALSGRIDLALRHLRVQQQEWTKQASSKPSSSGHDIYNTGHLFESPLEGFSSAAQLIMLLVVTMQVLTHASRREGEFLLAMIVLIVKVVLGADGSGQLGYADRVTIDNIPKRPETVVEKFDLKPKHTIYAVCPASTCHAIYPPTMVGVVPTYPRTCNHRSFPDGPVCSTYLTAPHIISGHTYYRPVKRFVVFDMKEWIASLVCQPGYEDKMDQMWKRSATGKKGDIFDGEYLSTFKAHDGTLFSLISDAEARYGVSMSLDFFNPHGNKAAGPATSVGVIALVCLNLPESERYKLENMFLAGIIPGPKEPPLTTIDHYLAPVVDQLVEFWEKGVKFSRTAKHGTGRLIRIALIVLVCDLPAARKTAGFAHFTHNHYCAICNCTLKEHGYGHTDIASWSLRTDAECRDWAHKFHSALTENEQESVVVASGVRWSQLIRLSYFDMAKCVVVDAMHNVFLGLIKDHYKILGIGAKKLTTIEQVLSLSYLPPPHFKDTEAAKLRKLQNYLNTPLLQEIADDRTKVVESLAKSNRSALRYLIEQLKCDTSSVVSGDGSPKEIQEFNRKECAQVLVTWRAAQSEALRSQGADTETTLGHVLSDGELQQLRQDINAIHKPSWLSTLPSSLGDPSHGKLKADQWRVLGTVYLPLALLHIWGLPKTATKRSRRCKDILHATLRLISAVILVSSRTIKEDVPDLYLQFMIDYMEEIKRIFPEYKFHPNHHMSLHLARCLCLFGPVHAWWTFPYERLIGMIQRIPTNKVLGELESTMSFGFHAAARLRRIFSMANCPSIFKNAYAIFLRLVSPRSRQVIINGSPPSSLFGRAEPNTKCLSSVSKRYDITLIDPDTHSEDDEDKEPPSVNTSSRKLKWKLPEQAHVMLLRSHLNTDASLEVALLRTCTIGGLGYSCHDQHVGNSFVVFMSAQGRRCRGRITRIMKVRVQVSQDMKQMDDILLLIQPFPVYVLESDPFPMYPMLRAQLLHSTPGPLQVVSPEKIISHFAALPIEVDGNSLLASISLERDL